MPIYRACYQDFQFAAIEEFLDGEEKVKLLLVRPKIQWGIRVVGRLCFSGSFWSLYGCYTHWSRLQSRQIWQQEEQILLLPQFFVSPAGSFNLVRGLVKAEYNWLHARVNYQFNCGCARMAWYGGLSYIDLCRRERSRYQTFDDDIDWFLRGRSRFSGGVVEVGGEFLYPFSCRWSGYLQFGALGGIGPRVREFVYSDINNPGEITLLSTRDRIGLISGVRMRADLRFSLFFASLTANVILGWEVNHFFDAFEVTRPFSITQLAPDQTELINFGLIGPILGLLCIF